MKRILVASAVSAAVLLCPPVSASVKVRTEEEFDRVVSYYYQNPRPQDAIEALEYLLKSDFLKKQFARDTHTLEMLACFFGRLAENDPKLLRTYEKLYGKAGREGQAFLVMTFGVFRDVRAEEFLKAKLAKTNDPRIAGVLAKPYTGRAGIIRDVESPQHMDLLWVEFLLTGDKEPVVKIVDVLAWKDVFAARLLARLTAEQSPEDKVRLKDLLARGLGLDVDVDQARIPFSGDMDILFASLLNDPRRPPAQNQALSELSQILGFSDDEVRVMATKGAANWSLGSNARQHPKVMEYCLQEMRTRKDKAAVELQSITGLRVISEGGAQQTGNE
ncbi:MAG: hypothetical protein Q8Q08_03415 [Candidatus Omnitrophota bacterium]|nr:hypothetical protein [Candidatus Omnitrophota bacterium]MDZ4243230.1 hypothetical protein [Candidatus Omnitrophota bacterium]